MYLRSVSNNKIDLFLPESFEWLILRSAIFDRNDNVQEILADPAEHIDCEKYFSWERFFTALLVAETNGKANLEYHENKIRTKYLFYFKCNEKIIIDKPYSVLI